MQAIGRQPCAGQRAPDGAPVHYERHRPEQTTLYHPSQHASVAAIFERYAQSLAKARRVIDALLQAPLPEPEPEIRRALTDAVMTPDAALGEEQRSWLGVLRR
ncbi:MAG: hypothetical protein JNJ89_01960 [Rubrivivax sp.]|nr:hypothetical protein [Rubrivivax sp.]